jgi:hypothetical protein
MKLQENISIKDKLYYFKRHLPELRNHLWDIITEGFDMFNPCDYDDYESYLKYTVHSCVITLINSYDELHGKGDTDEIEEIVTQYIKDNYIRYFKGAWRDKECDEDEDTINENTEEIEKDLSPIITELLDKIIVVNNEDVCKVEVTAPWNRKTISGGDYRDYAVKVYFIGGRNTKNWPRTMAVVMKEENIMGEIWKTVFNFMGLYVDLYSDSVKKCDEDINESVEDNNKERSEIETYILRRVPWNEILQGLDDGIKWAERRFQKYEDSRLMDMTLSQFGNMVMAVLMDHIRRFLVDRETQGIIYYSQVEHYLYKHFLDEIRNSYNRLIP